MKIFTFTIALKCFLPLFLKEELERRYLAIVHQQISPVSVKRNERMWQQVLLADASF